MVGTGADEVRIGAEAIRAQVEQDIGQAEEIALTIGPTTVSVHGDVGWVFAEPTADVSVDGQNITMRMRMTMVLVKDENGVRVHNGHLSVPFGAQAEGQSFAAS